MSTRCGTERVARSLADRALSPRALVEPPFLSQVGLLLTLRCPIRCRHCMVRAGPHRTEEMGVDEARGWLEQLAAYGTRSIGFTGGEPFYCWDKLLCLADTAARLGLTYTVVTNGFWADSPARAHEMLARLRPSDVSVSTDVYHAGHIPLENVAHVWAACQALGIRCDLSIVYDLESIEQTRSLVRRVLQFAPLEAIQISQVFPFGRAETLSHPAMEQDMRPASLPCLFASIPYLLPGGHVIACVGPAIDLPRQDNPLCLGSLHEASVVDLLNRSQANPILHGLRIWGPRFWHRLVEEHGPRAALPRQYSGNCPCADCMALLQQPQISAFLNRASSSEDLGQYVARFRAQYLHEPIP